MRASCSRVTLATCCAAAGSTAGRRFNTLLATSSINEAIGYHGLFKTMQATRPAQTRFLYSPHDLHRRPAQEL